MSSFTLTPHAKRGCAQNGSTSAMRTRSFTAITTEPKTPLLPSLGMLIIPTPSSSANMLQRVSERLDALPPDGGEAASLLAEVRELSVPLDQRDERVLEPCSPPTKER